MVVLLLLVPVLVLVQVLVLVLVLVLATDNIRAHRGPQEMHGRPTKAGDTFSAAHVVGFFDDIDAMHR